MRTKVNFSNFMKFSSFYRSAFWQWQPSIIIEKFSRLLSLIFLQFPSFFLCWKFSENRDKGNFIHWRQDRIFFFIDDNKTFVELLRNKKTYVRDRNLTIWDKNKFECIFKCLGALNDWRNKFSFKKSFKWLNVDWFLC